MNQTAGARLKQVRLEKGLSLEAVQKQTKINAHIIQALEGDGISTVSPVYLRSFLKLYCAYLGVDPKEFSSAGEHHPAQPRREEPRQPAVPVQVPPPPRPKEPPPAPVQPPQPQPEPPLPQPKSPPPKPKPQPRPPQPPRDLPREVPQKVPQKVPQQVPRQGQKTHHVQRIRKVSAQTLKKTQAYTLAIYDVASQRVVAAYKALVVKIRSVRISKETRLRIAQGAVALVALLVVVKIIAVAAGSIKAAASKHKARRSRGLSAQVQKKAAVPGAATPAQQAAPKPPAQTAQSEEARRAAETFAPVPKKAEEVKIRLIIRAKENSWVYLKSDGRVVFQRILEKGRFETWEAKERMELSVGNAGGIELDVNGKVFTNLGRRRQALKNIVITRDGLAINR